LSGGRPIPGLSAREGGRRAPRFEIGRFYPWIIAFLLIFIGYQLYRIVREPTFGLSALTIFDAFIVWLTWREWRKQTTDRDSPSS
jgi:uncharacterized membrane protein